MAYSDEVLEEKYRAQAEIARENQRDLRKMMEQAQRTTQELAKKYNIPLKYWEPTTQSKAS